MNLGNRVVLILVGLLFCLVGIIGFTVSSYINSQWIQTEGKVIGIQRLEGLKARVNHFPVIEYFVDGQTYTFLGESIFLWFPDIGDSKEIRYKPDSPSQAREVQGIGVKILLGLVLCCGLGAIVAGVKGNA